MKSVVEVPFNSLLGLEVAADESQLLLLPASPRYLNHVGTVHAGAQLAFAEASSGEFLLRSLVDSRAVVAVVRRVEAKFRNPANGALTSTATVEDDALERLGRELHRKGRAFISVTVELRDEAGTVTLSAIVEWFLQKVQTHE